MPNDTARIDPDTAWSQTGRYMVLESKPDAWTASWIDPGPELHSDAIGQVFYLRKQFVTQEPHAYRRVYVSADSQYKLWVNGRPVARGPARFDPTHQVYDTLDLSTVVVPGENVLAAEVMYWGHETRANPYFQISARPAFLFESAEIRSDATWKALICGGHRCVETLRSGAHLGATAGKWLETVDARHVPVDWQRVDFDDASWPAARALDDPTNAPSLVPQAERWGEQRDTSAPWKLIPRTLPPIEERPPEPCRPVQSGLVRDDRETPPFSFDVEPDTEPVTLPHTIPGDGETHYLVLDAGRLVNAYPMLRLEAAAGAVVEVMYAEAPSLNGQRDRRDALADRRVEGHHDVYITRDGMQTYEPLLHRTFWYVRVAVRTAEPLTLHDLSYRWTGYPFPERGAFRCADPVLNRIWEVGWTTQRHCAYDTYQDCPYFERLQYAGDVRIQALVTYYASGDARLARNAIRQLHASLLPEGLTQSRYPNNVFQVIPGYSLYWIMVLEDYWLHTGDLDLVRDCANGIYAILRFYQRHQADNGFVSSLPFWNFYDWTFEDAGVPEAHWENCTLSTMHYKGALDAGARLADALGDAPEAERFRNAAARAAEQLNRHAWDETEGLYTDGIATRMFSQHVNAFAVLFDVADEGKKRRIADRLFDDARLRSTTFYFAHYLHEAASRLGEPERILADMARWQSMLDKGTSTWWETPDDPRSECHAWSSTPTYRLMTEILGVRPLQPGFALVEIRPYAGHLDWAEGTVPTPHGDIHVRWEHRAEFVLDVALPDGIEADVVLPGGHQQRIGPGQTTLREV